MNRFWQASALALWIGLTSASRAPADHRSGESASNWTPALLAVESRGRALRQPIHVLTRPDGRVLVTGDDLRRWRIDLTRLRRLVVDGRSYYSLSEIRGLRYRIDSRRQVLSLEIASRLLVPTVLSGRSPGFHETTAAAIGGFFNYELRGEAVSGADRVDAHFEVGVFHRAGVFLSTFAAPR